MDKKINISWDILVKKVRWGLTPEEESAFQEWLAQDKSHEVYFERVRKVWGAEEPTSSLKSNLSKVMTHYPTTAKFFLILMLTWKRRKNFAVVG